MDAYAEPSTTRFLPNSGEEHDCHSFPQLPLWWFLDWGVSYLFIAVDSGPVVRALPNMTSWTVLPRQGTLWRLSSMRSNLSSIACEFCCRTMLYMLFNSSLAPCRPRLTWSIEKPSMVSGCETEGGVGWPVKGAWINPTILGTWRNYRCNKTSSQDSLCFTEEA